MATNININTPSRWNLVQRGSYILDIQQAPIEKIIRTGIAKIGGTVVDSIDKTSLPAAIISDRKDVAFLVNVKEDEKDFKHLTPKCQEAVRNKVAMIPANIFLEKCRQAPHVGTTTPVRRSVLAIRDTPSISKTSGLEDEKHFIDIRDGEHRPIQGYVNSFFICTGEDFGYSLFELAGGALRDYRKKELEEDRKYEEPKDYVFKKIEPKLRKRAPGFCEICLRHTSDLYEHRIKDLRHQQIVGKDGFYDDVDQLIADLNLSEWNPVNDYSDEEINDNILQYNEEKDSIAKRTRARKRADSTLKTSTKKFKS